VKAGTTISLKVAQSEIVKLIYFDNGGQKLQFWQITIAINFVSTIKVRLRQTVFSQQRVSPPTEWLCLKTFGHFV